MSNLFLSVIHEKCPFCEKGLVFKKSKSLLTIPQMNERCSECNTKFIGEPGYYIGAMYVSYALAIAIGVAIFITSKFIFQVESYFLIIGFIISGMILFAYKNFKWSRIIWLKIFPPIAR